jgi:hypothetical protein
MVFIFLFIRVSCVAFLLRIYTAKFLLPGSCICVVQGMRLLNFENRRRSQQTSFNGRRLPLEKTFLPNTTTP